MTNQMNTIKKLREEMNSIVADKNNEVISLQEATNRMILLKQKVNELLPEDKETQQILHSLQLSSV